jgi:hypothetical protein
MNAIAPTDHSAEHAIVAAALAALGDIVPIDGKLLLDGRKNGLAITLKAGNKTLNYLCVVKGKIDRIATLVDLRARAVLGHQTILVCETLSSALGEQCRRLSIQFIDTAGNAYLDDGQGVLIYVVGRKPEHSSNSVRRDTTVTPAQLKLMFGALAEPALLNASYRDIADAVGIATGTIAKAFDTLETAGLIATTATRTRLIRAPERMLSEWAMGYLHRLRPRLEKYRFTSDKTIDPGWWTPENRMSAWGGEQAAALVTRHLKPASTTIYMRVISPKVLAGMVKTFHLRADPNGSIEVVKAFWNMDKFADSFPTVPLHLIYADLLETNDPRNLAVAELIVPKVIEHVHNAQGQAA